MESTTMNPNRTDIMPSPAPGSNQCTAWEKLRGWQGGAADLAFVYARSLGGLVQTGRGRIISLSETAMTINATGSSLFVVLAGARFDDSPQVFFTADLSGNFQVAGIGINLANYDWLFLSVDQVPKELVVPGHGIKPKLQNS